MNDIANLVLAADSRQLVEAARALRQVQLGSVGAERAAKGFSVSAAGINAAMARTSSVVGGLYRQFFSLKTLLGTIGATLAVREIVQTADAYQRLSARVKLVSSSVEDHKSRMEDLFQIAQRTRSDFESLTDTYTRVANATARLGFTTKDLSQFTENLSKAIQISGTTSMEASAGLIQLSQGLASGRLQGDELRSVFENLIGVVQVLEEQTGKTRGELRKMAAEGALTPKLIVSAIIAGTDSLNKKFAEFPVTVDQAMAKLRNEFFRVTGEANQATQGTRGLVNAIEEIRKVVANPEFSRGMELMLTHLGNLGEKAAMLVSRYEQIAHNAGKLAVSFGPAVAVIAAAASVPFGGGAVGVRNAIEAYREGQKAIKEYDKAFEESQRKQALADANARRMAAIRRDPSSVMASGGVTIPDSGAALTEKQIESSKRQLEIMNLQNQALAAQVSGNETLAQQLETRARVLSETYALREGGQAALADQTAAQIEREAMLNQALEYRRELVEGLKTPWEQYGETIKKINVLQQAGAVTAQQAAKLQMIAGAQLAGTYLDAVGSITGALSGLFEENKALAIANATINTLVGITKAFELPFPLNFAQAAAVSIAGFAQVAKIRSTNPAGGGSFGGGFSAGGRGGGSFGGGSFNTRESPIAPTPVQQRQPAKTVHITLQGDNPFSREQVLRLIEEINDAVGDGALISAS